MKSNVSSGKPTDATISSNDISNSDHRQEAASEERTLMLVVAVSYGKLEYAVVLAQEKELVTGGLDKHNPASLQIAGQVPTAGSTLSGWQRVPFVQVVPGVHAA